METLRQLGGGAARGLGVALTPLAMAQAARSGRNPFDIIDEIQGGNLRRQLQEAQLADLQQRGLIQRASALQDPATRALLAQTPEAAGAFGLPTVPSGIASPEVLAQAGNPPVGGNVAMLPPQAETTESLQRQALKGRSEYFDLIRNIMKGEQGGAPQAGGAGAPATGGLMMTGLGPGGPTFGQPETLSVEAGTLGPTGAAVQPGERIGKKIALVKPGKAAQQHRARLSLIDSALEGFNAIYKTRIDPKSGKADPAGILPRETLPSATSMGGVAGIAAAVLPRGVFGIANRVKAAYGNRAAQAIQTGEGTVVTFVKAMGDAANAAQQEQERAINAFLPNSGDTQEQAAAKEELTPRVLAAVREKLAATIESGQPIDDATIWSEVQSAAAQVEQAVGGGTPGAFQPAGGPGQAAPGLEALRDQVRALGATGRTLRRAKGGPVPAGRVALVGEGGAPELVTRPKMITGPAQVEPMQLAQSALQVDLRQRAAMAARQAAETSRRLSAGAHDVPLRTTGGGGFQGAAPVPPPARTMTPPGQVGIPTSAPLTAAQLGGAQQDPNAGFRVEIGPDMVPRRVPIQ